MQIDKQNLKKTCSLLPLSRCVLWSLSLGTPAVDSCGRLLLKAGWIILPGKMIWARPAGWLGPLWMGTYGSILSPYGIIWAHVGPILAYQGEEKKHILPSRMIILPPGHHPASNNKLHVARFWALYVMASSFFFSEPPSSASSGSGFLVSSAGSKNIGHVKVQQVSTARFTRNRDNRRISQRDNKHNCIRFFTAFLDQKIGTWIPVAPFNT